VVIPSLCFEVGQVKAIHFNLNINLIITTMKKSDLVLSSLPSNIGVGSRVVFIDGSYTLSLIEDTLIHTYLGLSNDIFKVVAINVQLPSDERYINYLISSNNCIVRNEEDGTYHFCSDINIHNIKHLGSDKPFILKESGPSEIDCWDGDETDKIQY